MDSLLAIPGRLYVVATLLPLAAFVVLLLAGTIRWLCWPHRHTRTFGATLYRWLGGDTPNRYGAYIVLLAMAGSAVLAVTSLQRFVNDPANATRNEAELASRWSERMDWFRIGPYDTAPPEEFERQRAEDENRRVPRTALALELGYRIDHLTALMFAMVTVVGTAIVLFSIGYMGSELDTSVHDHEVDVQNHTASHFHRRGRYGRFFLFLALFCFSMLNLLIADNLFQIFVSWELVGVCSFFLIGFYYELRSASTAANKAFIMNRIGDAGFLVAIMIAWSSFGTLNIQDMVKRVRPAESQQQLVFVNLDSASATRKTQRYELPAKESDRGTHLALYPLNWPDPSHFHPLGRGAHKDEEFEVVGESTYTDFAAISYGLFVLMGVGLFLGCMGKSAQMPLHTWLPDAMEGPTPVSALIHAATMVAAGVYLVGRCFALFAPEVLLGIAYTGAITMFVAATIALVMTDIKRVLAYSTVSQLGMMMLALSVGGWIAGLLHLLTHAFFKALLFLGAGSVIHGCHHEQDLRKYGGLRVKMRTTSLTMLVGVLAIAGTPFFSGWYSKDLVLQSALAFGLTHPTHIALFILPLITAAMTAFYMFRLWFLTFTGTPRDEHVHAHAHESPSIMTLPLVFLAACSVGVAWGWPLWEAHASLMAHALLHAQPGFVATAYEAEQRVAHEWHWVIAGLALLAAILGAGLSAAFYWNPRKPTRVGDNPPASVSGFLAKKWYFDELYDTLFTRPMLRFSRFVGSLDKRSTEGSARPERFDGTTLDGMLNTLGDVTESTGWSLKQVQTGRLRTYVLFLALTTVAMLGILTVLRS